MHYILISYQSIVFCHATHSQDYHMQPADYCASKGLPAPLSLNSSNESIASLTVAITKACLHPYVEIVFCLHINDCDRSSHAAKTTTPSTASAVVKYVVVPLTVVAIGYFAYKYLQPKKSA